MSEIKTEIDRKDALREFLAEMKLEKIVDDHSLAFEAYCQSRNYILLESSNVIPLDVQLVEKIYEWQEFAEEPNTAPDFDEFLQELLDIIESKDSKDKNMDKETRDDRQIFWGKPCCKCGEIIPKGSRVFFKGNYAFLCFKCYNSPY